jgi:hypothetical protein
MFVLATAVAPAWAATSDEPSPALVRPPTAPPSIRGSLEALRRSPLVLLPARREPAAATVQSGGGRGMNTAAKAAIWIAAIGVTSVWAYKTFSVTRGTD